MGLMSGLSGVVMGHSMVQVYLHVVFTTKNRDSLMTPELEERLFPYIHGIGRKQKTPVLAINGDRDHVHILLKIPSTITIAKAVGAIKASSSGKAKELGVPLFDWQDGYGAFSCSKNHVEPVISYIQRQKEHHRTLTYDEEMARYAAIWELDWVKEKNEFRQKS